MGHLVTLSSSVALGGGGISAPAKDLSHFAQFWSLSDQYKSKEASGSTLVMLGLTGLPRVLWTGAMLHPPRTC